MEQVWIVFKYILLGIFQGFTEPIPISSSGHLILMQHLFGIKNEGFRFELIVNFASLLAVMLVYKKVIFEIGKNSSNYLLKRSKDGEKDFKFALLLIVATIPVGIIGFLYGDVLAEKLKSVTTVGVSLIITSIALFYIRKMQGVKNDGEIKVKDALVIGLSQVLALVPGISRSGATIVTGMSLGLKQKTALKFSFIMYIPVSLGGLVLSFGDFINNGIEGIYVVSYLSAFLAAFVATYFSLRWFMNVMRKGNLIYFSIYCFVVGVLVLLFL